MKSAHYSYLLCRFRWSRTLWPTYFSVIRKLFAHQLRENIFSVTMTMWQCDENTRTYYKFYFPWCSSFCQVFMHRWCFTSPEWLIGSNVLVFCFINHSSYSTRFLCESTLTYCFPFFLYILLICDNTISLFTSFIMRCKNKLLRARLYRQNTRNLSSILLILWWK